MAEYRLFRFDPVSGLASEEILKAANDDQARELMVVRAAGADCELWFGDRLVAFLGQTDR
jgi:hypothetical protein